MWHCATLHFSIASFNLFKLFLILAVAVAQPIIDLSKFNPADYPIDDEDERMRQQRAKEMAEGVDVSVLLGGLALANNADLYPAHSQVK